jgi:hypothetical protein
VRVVKIDTPQEGENIIFGGGGGVLVLAQNIGPSRHIYRYHSPPVLHESQFICDGFLKQKIADRIAVANCELFILFTSQSTTNR